MFEQISVLILKTYIFSLRNFLDVSENASLVPCQKCTFVSDLIGFITYVITGQQMTPIPDNFTIFSSNNCYEGKNETKFVGG
jgi:hypothetical protein